MDRLTRLLAALVRGCARLLPGDRQEWAEALLAEAGELPAGPRRLAWLAGGVRLSVTAAPARRAIGRALAFALAVAVTAVVAWPGPAADPAVLVNRVDVIVMVALLAGLPLAVRRWLGPPAGTRLATGLRAGGYAAILALVLVKAIVERFADAPVAERGLSPILWPGDAIFLLVMAGYATLILGGTARRPAAALSALRPAIAVGAGMGLLTYALGPLGYPLGITGAGAATLYDAALALGALLGLAAPVVLGVTAARRAARGPRGPRGSARGPDPARLAAQAGLAAGATAALVITAASTATIALLPHQPALLRWAAGHHNSGFGHDLGVSAAVFAANSSWYAAGYLLVLIAIPVLSCGFAAWAGLCVRRPGLTRRPSPDDGWPARPPGSADGAAGAPVGPAVPRADAA